MKKMKFLAAALLVTSALGTQASLAQSHSRHSSKVMFEKNKCYQVVTDDNGTVISINQVAC
jgi:hypothetical protein